MLERYLDSYDFSEESRIRREGDALWIPALYCHNGHSLMSDAVSFGDHPSVHIQVRAGDVGPKLDFHLSSIINDPRKQGPDLPQGTFSLLCPICGEELRKLVPCTCRPGAYRRAIYLTPNPDEMGAVGVCEVFGCPQSFVTEDGELLYEVIVEGLRSAGR